MMRYGSREHPGYETKQSDGEVPVMPKLWERWSTLLLPSLSGLLWPRLVAPERVLSIDQKELNCVLLLNYFLTLKPNCLK